MGQWRVRRQLEALTLQDLREVAVWEQALDEVTLPGHDEFTLRPFPHGPGPLPRRGGLYVRTRFWAATGREFVGYCMPDPDDRLGVLQPTIVTEQRQVSFWFGLSRPARPLLAQLYAALDCGPHELFPLRFTATFELPGGTHAGMVPAFMGLASIDDPRVVEYR